MAKVASKKVIIKCLKLSLHIPLVAGDIDDEGTGIRYISRYPLDRKCETSHIPTHRSVVGKDLKSSTVVLSGRLWISVPPLLPASVVELKYILPEILISIELRI
jgi:hypothetical protein